MEWQPIETAPQGDPISGTSGVRVLLVNEFGAVSIGRVEYSYRRKDKSWKSDFGISLHGEPTHWMPLPPPPST